MKKPELPKETENYYFQLEPVYDHYKDVKVIDRCEECGHKTGEHFEKRGVKVIGWEVKRCEKDLVYLLNRDIERGVDQAISDILKGKQQ